MKRTNNRQRQSVKVEQNARRYPIERKFEMNELHWEKGYSINKLKISGFSEAVVMRELFQSYREWQKFKETLMGTLNPEGMR